MALSKSRVLLLGAAFALSGCSFTSETLFPSLRGGGEARGSSAALSPGEPNPHGASNLSGPPVLGSTSFDPGTVTPGQPTGTFVGQKVQGLRVDLRQLQDTLRRRNVALQSIRTETVHDSQGYHESVAMISARLQIGTTPGNPILNRKWGQAQVELDKINLDIASMNKLATQVASDSAMAAYLLDSVRAAFGLSGAVEEDHRQLRILEDETSQTTVLIERLLSELSQDISRQQSYVANERGNLNTLALGIKNGQTYGMPLANQAAMHSVAGALLQNSADSWPSVKIENRRPLVMIRFNRPNVSYGQPLYQAVSRAVERRPDASFDLVAVTPAASMPTNQKSVGATTARHAADRVRRSLIEMGLGADHIHMSAMLSPTATTPEVHLYVR